MTVALTNQSRSGESDPSVIPSAPLGSSADSAGTAISAGSSPSAQNSGSIELSSDSSAMNSSLASSAGSEVEIPDDMILVRAGKFWRGSCNEVTQPACGPTDPGYALNDSPDNVNPEETPRREIFLDAFLIDAYEVTVADFEACISAGMCRPEHFLTHQENIDCNYGDSNFSTHPMNCVNWIGAGEYCEFANKRLPSEAEWEKAARGDDGRKYSWGDEAPTCALANVDFCIGQTSEVGSYPAGVSPSGAYDMAGNVAEWVADWYAEDYYREDYSQPDFSPDQNPGGPASGSFRVSRGGNWYLDTLYANYSRSASRAMDDPSFRDARIGFRCAAQP
jgi:formylglycine-generating enzyme required for sulfatase activity